ncbi:MAG: nucleotidyltransferase domain-containing protein [Anaerolineales bacterium]|nr:nucleotidyltransferase domain-containing protein [Anaerolineales bacterium]
MDVDALPFFPAVLDALRQLPDVAAIYLIGSAARGELSARSTSAGLELFSDLEFFVVTEKTLPASVRQPVFARLAEIERDMANPNPLFHLDVGLREKFRLPQMLPTIFTFELKQNGKLLFGEDLRTRLPEITLRNLDTRDANEILYKRLWALLLHLPKRCTADLTPAEHRVAGYIFARNALDIPTVLLPQAGILLPTYRQRVEKLAEIYPSLPFAPSFGPEFPAFLQTCLQRRLDLAFEQTDMAILYAQTIQYLELALACVSRHDARALPGSTRGFNERPVAPRQWLSLARMGGQFARRHGPRAGWAWVRLPKKEVLTQGLLAMHLALLSWHRGEPAEATSHLQASQTHLRRLTGQVPALPPAFPDQWQVLRKAWGGFWGAFIRLGQNLTPYDAIMEWQHE